MIGNEMNLLTDKEIAEKLTAALVLLVQHGRAESNQVARWIGCVKALGEGTTVYEDRTFDRLLDEYGKALRTIEALRLELGGIRIEQKVFQGLEELKTELEGVRT